MRRNETPYPICVKFCLTVDIPRITTYAKFGDDRLRGLGVAGVEFGPFPLSFDRRPYNTVALPCECVIKQLRSSWIISSFHLQRMLDLSFSRANTRPQTRHFLQSLQRCDYCSV